MGGLRADSRRFCAAPCSRIVGRRGLGGCDGQQPVTLAPSSRVRLWNITWFIAAALLLRGNVVQSFGRIFTKPMFFKRDHLLHLELDSPCWKLTVLIDRGARGIDKLQISPWLSWISIPTSTWCTPRFMTIATVALSSAFVAKATASMQSRLTPPNAPNAQRCLRSAAL